MLYILKTYVAQATEFSNTNIHHKVSNSNLYTMNLLRQFYCVPDDPQTCNLSASVSQMLGLWCASALPAKHFYIWGGVFVCCFCNDGNKDPTLSYET